MGLTPQVRLFGILCAGLLLAAGCAARRRKPEVAIFFPPAPDPPRLQYLTSFSGLKDVEEQSAFNRFIVGEKPDLKLDKPYGVAVHDGKIYVCDTNTGVVVLDLQHKVFGPLSGAVGQGKLTQPINIRVDSDGTKYVADPVRGQVVAFDKSDAYLRSYAVAGGWKPVDAVPMQDRLYVADPANGLIRVFEKQSGTLIESIGAKGDPSERLDRPTNIAFDGDGDLYVTDVGRFQVVRFDRDGHFKGTIGRPGDNLGHFARPKGVAVDRENHVYVVDAAFGNVQIFTEEGRLLMFFGEDGSGPGGLVLPAQVVIDYDNLRYFQQYIQPDFDPEYLVFVTSQFGARLVSVFAYGRQKGQTYPTDTELLETIQAERHRELEKLQSK